MIFQWQLDDLYTAACMDLVDVCFARPERRSSSSGAERLPRLSPLRGLACKHMRCLFTVVIIIYIYLSIYLYRLLMCMCICVFRRLSNSIIIIVIIIIIAIVIVTVSRQGLRRGVTRHRFVSWRVRIAAAYHRLVTRWRRAALITAARLTANSANMANNNII